MKRILLYLLSISFLSTHADLSVNFNNQSVGIASGGTTPGDAVAVGSLMQLVWSATGVTTSSGNSYDVGAGKALAGEYILDEQVTINTFGFYGHNTGVYTSADVGGADINSGYFFLRAFDSATGGYGGWVRDFPAVDASAWVYNSVDTGTIYQDNLTGGSPGSFIDIQDGGYPLGWFSTLPEEYYLTIEVIGSGSITGATSGENYDLGDEVSLSAVADEGWLFTGWSGSISRGYSESNTVITIDSDMVITATFSEDADNDGLSNIQEAEVGTNPRYSESLIELYNLVSNKVTMAEAQAAMRDLRVGSQTFDVSNGTATIRMYIDESSNLTSSWTNTQHVLEVDIPADQDTMFYRFRMD